MSKFEGLDTRQSNYTKESPLNLEFEQLSKHTTQNTSFQFFADWTVLQKSKFEDVDTVESNHAQESQANPESEWPSPNTPHNTSLQFFADVTLLQMSMC
jgi:hypothetical protein